MSFRGSQNGQRALETDLPIGFGCSDQLPGKCFFNSRTPSMRKVDKGGEKNGENWGEYGGEKRKKKITPEIVAIKGIASPPPEH